MEEILNETESRNTKNVIQVASKLFEDYINNKLNLCSDDLCDKSNEEIVQILRTFYCSQQIGPGQTDRKLWTVSRSLIQGFWDFLKNSKNVDFYS
jgi:hypothetical protein